MLLRLGLLLHLGPVITLVPSTSPICNIWQPALASSGIKSSETTEAGHSRARGNRAKLGGRARAEASTGSAQFRSPHFPWSRAWSKEVNFSVFFPPRFSRGSCNKSPRGTPTVRPTASRPGNEVTFFPRPPRLPPFTFSPEERPWTKSTTGRRLWTRTHKVSECHELGGGYITLQGFGISTRQQYCSRNSGTAKWRKWASDVHMHILCSCSALVCDMKWGLRFLWTRAMKWGLLWHNHAEL